MHGRVFGSEALSEILVGIVLPANIEKVSPEVEKPVLKMCDKLILLHWDNFFDSDCTFSCLSILF